MRLLLSLLVILSLVACSSSDEVDLEPAELVDFKPEVKLKTIWKAGIGDGQDVRYTKLIPALDSDRLYATDIEGTVYALSRDKGKRVWRAELEKPVSGGVGVAANLVLVGTYAGEVIALDRETGEQRWSAQLSSEVLAAPAGNASVVVAQTGDGKLYGLSAEDGKQLWRYDNPVPALSLRGTAAPVVERNTVFAAFASGKLVALNIADGAQVWEQRIAVPSGQTELERMVDIDGTPLVADGIIYTASYQGRLIAIARGNGRGLWASDASSYNNLAYAAGQVIMSSANDSVIAFNAGSGEINWQNDQLVRRKLSGPAVVEGYVAVADFEGYVHFLSLQDGHFVARDKVDGDGVRANLISDGKTLYVLGNSGRLEAISNSGS